MTKRALCARALAIALVGLLVVSSAPAVAAFFRPHLPGPLHRDLIVLRGGDQNAVVALLRSWQVTGIQTTTLVSTVTARLTGPEAAYLASLPSVSQVVADSPVAVPAAAAGQPVSPTAEAEADAAPTGPAGTAGDYCGTQAQPTLAPEALSLVNATQAQALGYDGAGVTVAVLADGIDPQGPDLVRAATYGRAGTPVVDRYVDFSGDGTRAATNGAEAFGDVSSIAAQGNKAYDLSRYVSPGQAARLPAGGCWVRIVGAAPGADVMVLKVLPEDQELTLSGVLQAVQYAVAHGARVINESFGFDYFPDSWLDVVRDADDAAVADGVTVVVAAGDGGSGSTIGSPATDPEVISVGATTSFAAYAQTDEGGFDNPAVGNGQWLDNNVSSLSSGGFSQNGNTIDLVAPGEANWALCSTNTAKYSGCTDSLGGQDIGAQVFGGTSEAAPLTAAAAADVVQAYASSHGGANPSPSLVKDILTSSATDIDAPADEEGAGLLNVGAAVQLALSAPAEAVPGSGGGPLPTHPPTTTTPAPGTTTTTTTPTTTTPAPGTTTTTPSGTGPGPLVAPGEVSLAGAPGSKTSTDLTVTNTSDAPTDVRLSTRALGTKTYDTGARDFTMVPTATTSNTGTFAVWGGVTEVYQTETFPVPAPAAGQAGPTRLVFSVAYPSTDQTSPVHVALFAPDGTYAGYSDPQGVGDYGQVEVSDPVPGTWTALFFTEQDGATVNAVGSSGRVEWDAATWAFTTGGIISPATLALAPGQTAVAHLRVPVPTAAGDTDQSVVVQWPGGRTTVPVTVRSVLKPSAQGAQFSGVLTGGNGRAGTHAQADTYWFTVPRGRSELDVSITLANDPDEPLVGYLVSPDGAAAAFSSNYTLLPEGQGFGANGTRFLQLYDLSPEPGQWAVDLEWVNPVTGNELAETFHGSITFRAVRVSTNLPDSAPTLLARGTSKGYQLKVTNTGVAPEAIFLDPRDNKMVGTTLPNVNKNVKSASFNLPLPAGLTFPLYVVPTNTTQLSAVITRKSGREPVTFDMSYYPGDPDISPARPEPGLSATSSAASASAVIRAPDTSAGVWAIVPSEVGPYQAAGPSVDSVSIEVRAELQGFDPAITSATDDFWQTPASFNRYVYLAPGQSRSITVHIKPSEPTGTVVSGTVYVDNFTLASLFTSLEPSPDELAEVPYTYTVGAR